MAGKKDNRYEGMSASKAKRERAKDEREALKRSAKRTRAILIAIPVAQSIPLFSFQIG